MSVSRTTTETLQILPCPFCGRQITVRDCGYSSFNPGFAKCVCGREWELGYVDDTWHAGVVWNRLQPTRVRVHELTQQIVKLQNEIRKLNEGE